MNFHFAFLIEYADINFFSRLFVGFITAKCWRRAIFLAAGFEVILIFDHMIETSIRSVFIMILVWQAHQNLSIISGSPNTCEGHVSSCGHASNVSHSLFPLFPSDHFILNSKIDLTILELGIIWPYALPCFPYSQ